MSSKSMRGMALPPLRAWPEGMCELWDERAAILEVEGGYSLLEARRLAVRDDERISKIIPDALCELDVKLQEMGREEALAVVLGYEGTGDGELFYDENEDLWIAPNPYYPGEGFGFVAIRGDDTWFCGVVPPGKFQ